MKRVVAFILIMCCMFSLFGCNGSNEEDDRIKVVIWHRWNVGEGEGEHELQVAVDNYNKSQDRVEVVLEAQPSSGFSDKVYNAVANGVGPDIVFEFATTLNDYQEHDLLANMDEYIDVSRLKTRISDELWNEAWSTGDGHLHIVPIQVTVPVLFYNKTLYEKYDLSVPTTWDELENNSRIIYENEGISGFATDSYIDLAQTQFYQNAATYIDVEKKCIGFNNEDCQESVEWFVNAVNKGYFATDYSTGSIDGDFNSGLLASFMGTCSYEPYIIPNGFEYGVAPLPSEEMSNWIPLWNRGAVVFASDETKEQAACEFIEYFTNKENSMKWCTSIGALSPYSDSCEENLYVEYLESSDVLQIASSSLDRAGTTPAICGCIVVRNEIKQMYLQAIGGVKSIEELFNETEARCNEALQK